MKNKLFIGLAICLSVILLSIGYSAFQNTLSIDGISASVRVDADMRVMGVRVSNLDNASSINEEFNVNSIMASINLPDSSSSVTYDIDVYNLGNVMMAIRDISSNSDKLKYEFVNYNLRDKICDDDKCILGVKKTVQLKVSYKDGEYDESNTQFNLKVNFDYGRIFSVKYRNIEGSDTLTKEIMEGDTLNVSFVDASLKELIVVMNDKFLSSGVDYTYSNNNLVIPSVNGDIVITLQGMTEMKKTIISNFVTSGKESDIPLYDFGSMTHDERKDMFSNVETEPTIIRTNGIKGESDAILFRGNVTNNYVRFAGYYWRILQVDEDGNLRIILDDSLAQWPKYSNSSTITSIDDAENIFNYKNSNVKKALDNWTYYYEPWKDKVVTSKFCNDLNYVKKISSGSNNLVYYFNSYQNIGSDVDKYDPTLTCEKNSLFDEEIGMISAEEYVLAGGAFMKENKNFFLYNSALATGLTWTLSPAYYDTVRSNGDLFLIDSTNGMLMDYVNTHLSGYNRVRPVITLDGDVAMIGNGTRSNPYRYEGTETADRIDISDLSVLGNDKWYIGSIVSKKQVYGIMSDSVSTKLNNVNGLLGKNTAYFNERLNTINSFTGVTFSFIDGVEVDNGYLYKIRTDDGRYLRINSDNSVELTNEEVNCLVGIVNDTSDDASKYEGMVMIMNESGSNYLNFYGSNSGSGDDKFAGWSELDVNAYISLFKADIYG